MKIEKDLTWRFGDEKIGEIRIDKQEVIDYMGLSALALMAKVERLDHLDDGELSYYDSSIKEVALGPLYSGKAFLDEMSYEQLCEIRGEVERAISRKIEEFRK